MVRADIERLLTHLLIIRAIFLYLFLNYAGQEITNHNDHVFSTA